MNNSIKKNIGMIVLILFTLASVQIACRRNQNANQPSAEDVEQEQQAEEEPQGDPNLLFQDDFQDGTNAPWTITTSWNVQQDGDVYTFNSSAYGAAWIPYGQSWRTYVYQLNTQLEDGSLVLSIAMTQQGRYALHMRQDGLYLMKESPPGNISVLTQTGPISMPGWHQVELSIFEGHLQVHIDSALWIDYVDSEPLSNGTIAVSSLEGSSVAVDDVLVTRLIEPLVSGEVVAPAPEESAPDMPPADLSLDNVQPSEPSDDEQDEQEQDDSGSAVFPQVEFLIEGGQSATIDVGQCLTTEWRVQNASEVYYQGLEVEHEGYIDECPTQSTTYVLLVVAQDGQTREFTVTATVNQPQGDNGGGQQDGQADLVVQGVGIQPANPVQGQPIAVRVTIANHGDAEASGFNVYWKPEGATFIGCSWDVQSIAPGAEQTLTCDYQGYPQAGSYNWGARVDTDNEVAESNEGNNDRQGEIVVSED